MLHLIIGHRGTGKSHWLKIIKEIYREKRENVLCLDLDKEVEKSSQKNIPELFKEGEKTFREWEKKVFKKIIQQLPAKKKVFIALGAGFRLKKILAGR